MYQPPTEASRRRARGHYPRRVRLRWRGRARRGIFALADRHSQQIPKASRRWPLMHKRARYGDAGGAWTGSTSAQNGSRWCSAQTAFSRSRGWFRLRGFRQVTTPGSGKS